MRMASNMSSDGIYLPTPQVAAALCLKGFYRLVCPAHKSIILERMPGCLIKVRQGDEQGK